MFSQLPLLLVTYSVASSLVGFEPGSRNLCAGCPTCSSSTGVMQPRLKSDLPLTSELLSRLTSIFTPKQQQVTLTSAEAPDSTVARPQTASRKPASYELRPLSYVECSTDDVTGGFRSDLGVNIRRFSSPINISISLPSIMCLQPEQRAASASRKRLSDAGQKKLRWLAQLPMLTADHSILCSNKVEKLLLKANLDLNSKRYSGEVLWFAKWEGQPAKLKFRWSESNPSTVLFDAQMAIRQSAHKLRLTGHPHQLHSASVILGPPKVQETESSFSVQPLAINSSSSSNRSSSNRSSRLQLAAGSNSSADSNSSSAADQSVIRSFDQPGLQYELGWNLQQNSPVLSAARRFSCNNSSSSSCWNLRQVKAAYDGKASALSLSAAGGCWNFGMLFHTDASGPLGLPKFSQAGMWPKVLLTLTPDLALQ